MVKSKEVIRFNDVWNSAISFFQNNFKTLTILGLIFSFIPGFYVGYNGSFAVLDSPGFLPGDMAPVLLFLVLISTLYSFLAVGIAYMFKAKKKNISFMEVINSSSKYYVRAILLSIVMSIALVFLALLLILPAIAFFIYWIFSFYVLVFDESKVIESMKKSFGIVRGNWWNVFFMGLILLIVVVVISSIINYCVLLFSGFLSETFSLVLANLVSMYVALFTQVFFISYYLMMRK